MCLMLLLLLVIASPLSRAMLDKPKTTASLNSAAPKVLAGQVFDASFNDSAPKKR